MNNRTICAASLLLLALMALSGCKMVEKDGVTYLYPSLAGLRGNNSPQKKAKPKPAQTKVVKPVAADRNERIVQLGQRMLELDEAKSKKHATCVEGLLGINKQEQGLVKEVIELHKAEATEVLAEMKKIKTVADQEPDLKLKGLLGNRIQRLQEEGAVHTAMADKYIKDLKALEAEQVRLETLLGRAKAGDKASLE